MRCRRLAGQLRLCRTELATAALILYFLLLLLGGFILLLLSGVSFYFDTWVPGFTSSSGVSDFAFDFIFRFLMSGTSPSIKRYVVISRIALVF